MFKKYVRGSDRYESDTFFRYYAKFQLFLLIPFCFGALTYLALMLGNGMNTQYLSEFDNPDLVILLEEHEFGGETTHKFISYYGDDKYEVYLSYNPGGEFEKKRTTISIVDVYGDVKYMEFFHKDDGELYEQACDIFFDEYNVRIINGNDSIQ
jgi:hypothetical protein